MGATLECLPPKTPLPATLAFRAGDSSLGLLQITGIRDGSDVPADEPFSMSIRYKLVRGGETKTAMIPVAPKPAAIADPLPAIELKVAQQQLEKVLGDLLETQAALASELTEKTKAHPAVMQLERKLQVLEQQASQLRATIQQNATKP